MVGPRSGQEVLGMAETGSVGFVPGGGRVQWPQPLLYQIHRPLPFFTDRLAFQGKEGCRGLVLAGQFLQPALGWGREGKGQLWEEGWEAQDYADGLDFPRPKADGDRGLLPI